MYLKENYNSMDKFLTYFAVYGILKYIGGSIMVKIAVCDDELNALEEISERISNFFNKTMSFFCVFFYFHDFPPKKYSLNCFNILSYFFNISNTLIAFKEMLRFI